MRSTTLPFILISLLSGCSLYQSEGRKFLEDQAFQFKNQGFSIAVTAKRGHCVHTEAIEQNFFENDHWTLLATSFEPRYTVYEASGELSSLVIVQEPKYQEGLYICEYNHKSPEALEAHQKDDIEDAIKTVSSMLN